MARLREIVADRPVGGVTTHRIQRSIEALTIGAHRAVKARDEQQELLKGQEIEQQYKVDLVGNAGVRGVYEVIEITFDEEFWPATDRRDSTFEEPHFTYGFEMQSADPVILTASIKSWHRGKEGVVTGADVWIGSVAPGVKTVVKFKGKLHVRFQGYAQPYIEDDDEVS